MGEERAPADRVRWYFYQQSSGTWSWDAVGPDGKVLAKSTAEFGSRSQSIEDAKAHGYGGMTATLTG